MEARELDEKIQSLRKKMTDEFVKEVKATDQTKLKEMVVQYTKKISEVEEKKKADAAIKKLASDAKTLRDGYNDLKKQHDKEREYVLLTLQERGAI